MKAGKPTPWYKVRLPFILTLLLLFSLVVFGAHRILDAERFSARESVLRFDLQQIRNAIDQYKSDQDRAPNSLQDLVDAHYLKEIPLDPITRKQDWVLVRTTGLVRTDQLLPGIVDVQSNSTRRGLDGTPYNTW